MEADRPEALEPMAAVKRCRLGLVDGRPCLRPAVRGTFFRSTQVASCGEGHDHRAPHPSCTCGFYALADTDELTDRLGPWRPEEVEIDVELAGRVVRHERGLRGEHQIVLGVRLHPWCALCPGRHPRPTMVVGRLVSRRGGTDWHGLLPLCDRCSARAGELWTPAGLAASLGTEVRVDHEAAHLAASRRLRSRSRMRTAGVAALALVYLGLGIAVAMRGVGTGEAPLDPRDVQTVREAAEGLAGRLDAGEVEIARALAEGIGRSEVGPIQTTEVGELRAAVAEVGELCILAAAGPGWSDEVVRVRPAGGCRLADAVALEPS